MSTESSTDRSDSSTIDKRGDGKYLYRKNLATACSERYLAIKETPVEERSPEDHMIFYLMNEVGFYSGQLTKLMGRKKDPKEDESFFRENYEELLGRYDGIMQALQSRGYSGSWMATEIVKWLDDR